MCPEFVVVKGRVPGRVTHLNGRSLEMVRVGFRAGVFRSTSESCLTLRVGGKYRQYAQTEDSVGGRVGAPKTRK